MRTKTLVLRFNHLLFWWYYKRVSEHFRQWTFFYSVKMLIQNYESELLRMKGTNEVLRGSMAENDKIRKEFHNLKMQQVASPGMMDILNRSFGMDYKNPNDN